MDDNPKLGKRYEYSNSYWSHPLTFGPIYLYQVGELGCESGYIIDSHVQECHEISYIVSGEGVFYYDSDQYSVCSGDVFINTKGHLHTIQSSIKSPLRFFYLAFDINESYGNRFNFMWKMLDNPKSKCFHDKCDLLIYFSKLLDEIYDMTENSDIMIECYIQQILLLIYRFINLSEVLALPKPREETKVGYTIYSVLKYIDENIYEIQKVKNIADDLNYSYSYISHLFKEKMGVTLQSYVNKKKIEKAVDLLKDRRMNITQISTKLNYEVQSFSKSFKHMMKVSPMQFQKEYLKSKGEEDNDS